MVLSNHNHGYRGLSKTSVFIPPVRLSLRSRYENPFLFLSVPDTTSPKTAATMAMSLTKIKVTWEHGTRERLKGDLGGFYIKYQAVRIGGEPIVDLLAQPNYTVIVCANVNGVLLTNLTSYTMYKIQVAVITAYGIGNFSEPIYGGIINVYKYIL